MEKEKDFNLKEKEEINRFEYITEEGTIINVRDSKFTYSLQDNGKTLKVFKEQEQEE